MIPVYLRKCRVLPIVLFFLSSCSIGIPITPKDADFPLHKAFKVPYPETHIYNCLDGDLVWRHVADLNSKWWEGYKDAGSSQPDPDGDGKIYTYYVFNTDFYEEVSDHRIKKILEWADQRYLSERTELYGYTFTVHTTDDDIVTQCAVTQRYLGEKAGKHTSGRLSPKDIEWKNPGYSRRY
ncbi:MAG: hypothetical protein FWF99_00840 [Desulfovibrionaceae bacterium]|nr:hypothetical protein [Desulfovibrionaceae bacterium]